MSTPIDDLVLAQLRVMRRRGRRRRVTLEGLCDAVDAAPSAVRAALQSLAAAGWAIDTIDDAIAIGDVGQAATRHAALVHDLKDYQGTWFRFGVAGDKHLANMHARLDVMHLFYRLCAAEGITTVYDTGNWIDGEAKFNRNELLAHGLEAQIDYWIDHHPREQGITTYFVAGDDHEGWYQQREGIEIGRHAMLRARDAGREDLVYLGYAEALVELQQPEGSRWMMVTHPGGGSAYAISYKAQKYVESLQGGEKPAIVLQGHYHKANYSYPREVHVVDTATMCDQTLFMRKKQLQAHVGGWICEVMQAPDGRITRFRCEFLPFYDRTFYEDKRRKFGLPKGVKAA